MTMYFSIPVIIMLMSALTCDITHSFGDTGVSDNPWKTWQSGINDKHNPVKRGAVPRNEEESVLEHYGSDYDERTDDDNKDVLPREPSVNENQHQMRNKNNSNLKQDAEREEQYYPKLSETTDSSIMEGESLWPENCTYCAQRQANREYRLEQIRLEILAKLRLGVAPNITDKRLPPYPEIKEWLSKFPENPDPEVEEPMAKIISMINIAHPPPEDKQLPDMTNVCYFEFQSDLEATDIVSARLGVFVRQVTVPTNTITMFLIYKVKPGRQDNVLIKRRRITLNSEGTNAWYHFDIYAMVKGWVRSPHSNFGIQIIIFDDIGKSLAIVIPENENEALYKPYIEVKLKSPAGKSSRDKRSLSQECDDDMNPTTACCRYPMVVDFSVFGWDWILAPKSLQAHYCSGECSHKFTSTPFKKVVEQAQIESYTSCCVPSKFNELKMLYFSNRERIQFGVVQGIVVDSCGCV